MVTTHVQKPYRVGRKTGQLLHTLKGHTTNVSGVVLSRNIASLEPAGTLHLLASSSAPVQQLSWEYISVKTRWLVVDGRFRRVALAFY
jgi:hypothetical protein